MCKGGVDAVIDFVSSARTIKRSASVLREVRGIIRLLGSGNEKKMKKGMEQGRVRVDSIREGVVSAVNQVG